MAEGDYFDDNIRSCRGWKTQVTQNAAVVVRLLINFLDSAASPPYSRQLHHNISPNRAPFLRLD